MIYWAKIIIYTLGYIGLKLLDIFGKTMGYTSPLDMLIKIYGKYLTKKDGDIFVKLWDLFRKTIGYIWQKLWDILG